MLKHSQSATVSSSSVLDLLDSCNALGIPHNESPKLIRDALLNPEERIAEDQVIGLWREIAHNTHIPHVGLWMGQQINPSAKGLLASWVSQCETLGEAFSIFAQHIPLMNPSEQWQIQTIGKQTQLSFILATNKGYPVEAIERSMSALLTWGTALTGKELKPQCSRFNHPKPAYIKEYKTIFGCNLKFAANENSLLIDTHLLDLPIKSANPLLKKMIQAKASEAIEALNPKATLTTQIKRLIQDNLPHQTATIDHLSQALGMSRQTLYRRLKTEGCDFKTLLNDVRKSRALELIREDQSNTLHISLSLGFKETSSFYKAFHRWYGMSPQDYLNREK